MNLSRNNQGTSLIELVIAMAISAIVLAMIMFFIDAASNSFRRTSDEVNLQMEAQTTINQLSNLAMEATTMYTYSTPTESRYTFQYVNGDFLTIVYDRAQMKLYQVQTTGEVPAQTATYTMENNFLAEYVESLTISEPVNKTISIKLGLSLGKDKYQISKKVKLRNAH